MTFDEFRADEKNFSILQRYELLGGVVNIYYKNECDEELFEDSWPPAHEDFFVFENDDLRLFFARFSDLHVLLRSLSANLEDLGEEELLNFVEFVCRLNRITPGNVVSPNRRPYNPALKREELTPKVKSQTLNFHLEQVPVFGKDKWTWILLEVRLIDLKKLDVIETERLTMSEIYEILSKVDPVKFRRNEPKWWK